MKSICREETIMNLINQTNNIDFINQDYIERLLESNREVSEDKVREIIRKAELLQGLSHEEAAALIQVNEGQLLKEIYAAAGRIKQKIYGNRVVMFAPLYISNYCVNNCTYCGYKNSNNFERRKLNKKEIESEVKYLEAMGHKRIALELGEDPKNTPIEYVLEAIETIYNTKTEKGAIRRVNVNLAATSSEDYRLLKEANIGTYILFQETYHRHTYQKVHANSLKGEFNFHLNAFDRAMDAGIDDVGGGVLFGLYDFRFEVLGLILHNEHLEERFNVGFHTVSVPRLKKAEGMSLEHFDYLITDDDFKKIVSVLRLTLPFTGIILSTRESPEIREEVINYGISQISSGSQTGVGGYSEHNVKKSVPQFEGSDNRSPMDVIRSLLKQGFLPSYCTACYRSNRTGDRFMRLAKSGQIANVCQPNALMTLMEFLLDYGDAELIDLGKKTIFDAVAKIERKDIREITLRSLERIQNGDRDLYL